jgi:hypothetical protein
MCKYILMRLQYTIVYIIKWLYPVYVQLIIIKFYYIAIYRRPRAVTA